MDYEKKRLNEEFRELLGELSIKEIMSNKELIEKSESILKLIII